MSNNYFLLTNKIFEIIFIPEDDFNKMFEFKNSYVVKFKDNIKWHPMSGGDDTYLQSYCLNHARSDFRYGNLANKPMNIIGLYELDW